MYCAQEELHKPRLSTLEDTNAEVLSKDFDGHLSSSKEDKVVKKYLDVNVPYLPEVKTHYKEVGTSMEHASISLHSLLTSILTLMCANEAFEEHVVWFLDENGQPKENFIESGLFNDSYSIQGVLAATLLTIDIFNLPWLVHHQEFKFLKLIFKGGETS